MREQKYDRMRYLREKVERMEPEDREAFLKEMSLKDRLAYWRAELLRAYRDKLGNF